MRLVSIITASASLLLLLGACAEPVVRPILPEPVFNKYGDVSEAACRPEGAPNSSYYPNRLLTCESYCLPGEKPNYSTLSHVTTVPVCVPVGGDEPNRSDREPTTPNGTPNSTVG